MNDNPNPSGTGALAQARGSVFRPEAIEAFNRFAECLSGEPEIKRLTEIIDHHHRVAANARRLLDNGGFGPNWSQIQRIDKMLAEIAGLPHTQNAKPSHAPTVP